MLMAVVATSAEDAATAEVLARRLCLPLLPTNSDPVHCESADAVLMVSGSGLSLQQTGRGMPGPVSVDFGAPGMRHRRRAGNNELLGRAVGVGKKPGLRVIDATAGLGRDAFVLADLGCTVLLCEREPVVIELLRAGLQSVAERDDPWLREVIKRMRLCAGDCRQLAGPELGGVDVIYLDPMFPSRGKSAAVKKEMALFQSLLDVAGVVESGEGALDWALQQDVSRVVVKRPAKAPELGGISPSHCISGKAVRYDVHVLRKLM